MTEGELMVLEGLAKNRPGSLTSKLCRLATWLEVAETCFGGLPSGITLREVWESLRDSAQEIQRMELVVERAENHAEVMEDLMIRASTQ